MEVDVYADLLFLINTGMDGLCLILTGRLLHRKASPWRIIIAAVLGGMYAVLALFPNLPPPLPLILDVGVCFLMCAIVFCGKNSGGVRRYLLAVLLYFLLSMALGGIMTALYSLWNRLGVTNLLPAEEEGLGTWLFTLLAMIGGVITLWGGRFLRRAACVKECRVTILMGGHGVTLEGLVDTGNLLRDPLGGRAVICVDPKKLYPVLSPTLVAALSDPSEMSRLTEQEDARRIRLIPADTATGGQLLAGLLPDRVLLRYIVSGKEREKEADVIIAVSQNLSRTEALVPSELLD